MESVSGVRGIFGFALTPQIAMQYAASFGILQKRGKIVVGRDSRKTGPAMFHAVVSGLLAAGCDVVDIGVVSTPTVLLAVEESDAAGGISVTASHNPAEWNAMKFADENGMFLFPEKAAEMLEKVKTAPEFAAWDAQGALTFDPDATERHLEKIRNISYIDIDKIRAKKFKVVLDSVNGAGCEISQKLLEDFGCEVIHINGEPTGDFAHNPEPLEKNLQQIIEEVKKQKADIGFVTDPDVDRLAIVDENGMFVGEEFSLLLAEEFVLAKNPGDAVTNLSSSMASDDIAEKYGVKVHRTGVGEINVGKKMLEIKSPVGGEGNGGIICPEVHYTRDAPAGMALILGLLTEKNMPLSKIVAEIPRYFFAKDKIKTDPEKLDEIMKKVPSVFADYDLDYTDGIKVLGDKWWLHIRKSGTEPVIRVYAESESSAKSQQICDDAKKKLL
ncbi:MAG: phosphoglucosamine mutase [Candidatus Cloacimonadota bacterium]|nr:MAG: phosphoglucosamine mutase [Candidatus Cloacimonadota bacterium]